MKDNRGGARPGAGRPRGKKEWSERTKNELMKALKNKAKETGKGPWDVLADLLHSSRTPAHVRAHLLRLVADMLIVRESITESHEYQYGPGVMLPPVQPEPQEAIERRRDFTAPGMN